MNNRLLYMMVDLPSIRQNVKKNLLNLLFVSIIAGMCSYMLCDTVMKKQYTSTITFSVVSDSSSLMTNSYQIRLARQRTCTYLESGTFSTAVYGLLGVDGEEKNIEWSAEGLLDSNLIQVECTGNSPESVLRTVQVLRENGPEILARLTKTFDLYPLGSVDAEQIVQTSMSTVRIAVILGLLVFFAGLFWVIIEQIFCGKLQNRSQAEQELDLKLVGSVPHEQRKKAKQSMLIDSKLCSLDYVEAFQRTALSLMRQMKLSETKVLLITSVMENEGKSTTAANLALTIAKNGKRVLLIDADLRKPALYKIFETEVHSDFAEYLRGGLTEKQVIVKMPQEGLYCCFSSSVEDQADELLEKESLISLIGQMREKMDYIILDTSPAGSTRDASVLSSCVENILFVTRMNTAPIELINETVEELEDGKAVIIGAVLNDCSEVKTEKSHYGYHYRYSDMGKYGYYGLNKREKSSENA